MVTQINNQLLIKRYLDTKYRNIENRLFIQKYNSFINEIVKPSFIKSGTIPTIHNFLYYMLDISDNMKPSFLRTEDLQLMINSVIEKSDIIRHFIDPNGQYKFKPNYQPLTLEEIFNIDNKSIPKKNIDNLSELLKKDADNASINDDFDKICLIEDAYLDLQIDYNRALKIKHLPLIETLHDLFIGKKYELSKSDKSYFNNTKLKCIKKIMFKLASKGDQKKFIEYMDKYKAIKRKENMWPSTFKKTLSSFLYIKPPILTNKEKSYFKLLAIETNFNANLNNFIYSKITFNELCATVQHLYENINDDIENDLIRNIIIPKKVQYLKAYLPQFKIGMNPNNYSEKDFNLINKQQEDYKNWVEYIDNNTALELYKQFYSAKINVCLDIYSNINFKSEYGKLIIDQKQDDQVSYINQEFKNEIEINNGDNLNIKKNFDNDELNIKIRLEYINKATEIATEAIGFFKHLNQRDKDIYVHYFERKKSEIDKFPETVDTRMKNSLGLFL